MYRLTKRAKQNRERAAAMGRKSQQVQAEKWAKESKYASSCVELNDNEFYI